MVVNVIKWRPWPPTQSRKYEAEIKIRSLKGMSSCVPSDSGEGRSWTVEIRWKGGKKGSGLRAFGGRRAKRSSTGEAGFDLNGVVSWDEAFTSVCGISSALEEDSLCPFELVFCVFNGSDRRSKNKVMVAGPVALNLAEFASTEDKQELEISVPLTHSSAAVVCNPSLCLTLRLTELRTNQEPAKAVHRALTLPLTAPLSPCFGAPMIVVDKEEHTTPRKSLSKIKSLTEFVSSRRKSEKVCAGEANSDSKFSTGSEDSEYNDSFDTDSLDYSDELSEENKEDSDNDPRNSCGYGTLASANSAGGGFFLKRSCEDDDFVYYSNHQPELDSLYPDSLPPEVPEQSLKLGPKLGILTWKKRKLSFRSPKVKGPKGEPLLKKEYGERGGDDIDFDRYQLSSSDELSSERCKTEEELLSISEFGDDSFAVGSWERKEVVSRDGSMKLQTQVFFASIDQRNEKAAGESACTALVAVITNWLHSNRGEMPIKSELDSLIREGSLQWRNLCEVDEFMARFPDKHFDLETVLQAKIRPISVAGEKSFIGFFHPEGVEDAEGLGFLDGAMSFDNIWDEINRAMGDAESFIYIVSWNDHFFVLKVDVDAYYIIDTLGERLYEGCNQAYVLKFDKDTTIRSVPNPPSEEEREKPSSSPKRLSTESVTKLEVKVADERLVSGSSEGSGKGKEVDEETVVCKGKEACKEYIKSFLAAIPIRELQEDIKKGRVGSAPLHHRLQIEFHHTESLAPPTITEYTVKFEADAEADAVLA